MGIFEYITNIVITPEEIKQLQQGEQDVLSNRKKNILEVVLEFNETRLGKHYSSVMIVLTHCCLETAQQK